MNFRRFPLLLASALLALNPCPARAVELADYASYNGFTLSADPVLPVQEVHPSLWFKQEDLPTLEAKKTAGYGRELWEHLSRDPLLTRELLPAPEAGDDTKKIHEYYGAMSMLAKANALMSLLGPAETRAGYAQRATEALKRAYDGPVYDLDPKQSSSAVEEIYRAVWAQNYAAAYDWVQPGLSPEDDAAIRARLVKEAQTIHENLRRWTPRPHNHLSKPAWGLGSLALTLSREPQAREWLALALAASNENTKYFFSADGIYREGAHYLVFSSINFVPFLYHYRNVAGVDGFTTFQPVFEAVVAVRNAKGWLPNIYDSYLRPYPSHMVAAAYRGRKTWLNPASDLAGVLQWSWKTTDMGPFKASQKETQFDYTGASWDYEIEVDEFLTYDATIQPAAPSVPPTVFLEGGQSVFRSGWTASNAGQRYLLFHGVAQADNHFHYDKLSFVIQGEGQLMASDSGYSRKSYGEAIRKEWYITPAAHNVVTADGKCAVDVKENATPVSRDRLRAGRFAFEEKEAAFANGGLQKRAIAFIGGDYFVVIDQLSAPRETAFKLHLHGGRGDLAVEGNEAVWTYAKDAYGPAAKLATWTLPAGLPLVREEGELTYIKGDFAKFGYITAERKATATAFMQVLFPLPEGAASPGWKDLSDEGQLAALVNKDGAEDTLIARLPEADGIRSAGKLSAHARFAWARQENGALTAWAMQEGLELAFGGTPILTASAPLTATGEAIDGAWEITIASAPAEYQLTLPTTATSATFQNKPVPITSGKITLNGEGLLRLTK